MKKSLLIKIIAAVAVLGLILISFSARDILIDINAIDYTDSEIGREFENNRHSFEEAAAYLKDFGGGGVVLPMESSRYIAEKSFPDYISAEMRPVFSSVLTKYFSKIKFSSDPFIAVFYSINGQSAIVCGGEVPESGMKKDYGNGWYLYADENGGNPEESQSEPS